MVCLGNGWFSFNMAGARDGMGMKLDPWQVGDWIKRKYECSEWVMVVMRNL